jgi:transcriptional regulator with XRE-family HTH domain
MTHPLRLAQSLRAARQRARLSQLALALQLGVSQRHISFVENCRAKPSRELLLLWLQALALPLDQHNEVMLLAGLAPIYSHTRLDEPAMAQANAALAELLRTHDPMPCFVLDAQWNLLQSNQGGKWLASVVAPFLARDAARRPAGATVNMLDVLAHPHGFTKHLTNLAEIAPKFLAHMQDEARSQPSLLPKILRFEALVERRLGKRGALRTHGLLAPDPTPHPAPGSPLLTSRFATPFGELAFFSFFTTFGRPQDVSLASLRMEHLFAADDATRQVLAKRVRLARVK